MNTFETNTFKKLKNDGANNFPESIIVHHTGGTNPNPEADTSHHTAKMVEDYHLSLGWDGIGYHWFIEKNGDIWKGRPEKRNGAHTINMNTKSVGVCLAGNFDVTLPTKEQESSLVWLVNQIKSRYSIKEIVPHRKYANKTCYGKLLTDDWAVKLMQKTPCSLSSFTFNEIFEEFKKRLEELLINKK